MEELQIELIGCMRQADLFNGVHTEAYKQSGFSSDYLRKVRAGERNFKDTSTNRKKVKKIIKVYETLLNNAKKQLT